MIELVGPNYCYQGEQLTSPEIIVIKDHHYNEELECFPVEQLLNNSVCNSQQHTVIFDHVLQHDDVLRNYNLIYFPSFMARENTEFVDQQIVPDWNNKTTTFNFMINKPRPHRIQLLELIKQFELTNYAHSLAWRSNTVNDIAVTNYCFGPEVLMDRGVRNGHFKNALTYQGLLQKNVFEPTCVSLVTEPVFYERETIITEKTLMAMWAGTMPIWVGGWRIADWLQERGFDTFADVIDHSYQTLEDPAERVRQAIARNLHVLKDTNLAGCFTEQYQHRLQHNLNLLQNNFFQKTCLHTIKQHSGPIQLALQKLLGIFHK
jgi:hypothetical protein